MRYNTNCDPLNAYLDLGVLLAADDAHLGTHAKRVHLLLAIGNGTHQTLLLLRVGQSSCTNKATLSVYGEGQLCK